MSITQDDDQQISTGDDGQGTATGAPVLSGKKRRRGAADIARQFLPPLFLGALIIGAWYYVSYGLLTEERRFLLRPPHEILQVGFLEWDHFSEILQALGSSTRVALIGLTISITIGFFLSTIMSQTKIVERAIFPYMVMLQAIPILAIVPLIGFWWGYGTTSRIAVCVIISLFPIIVNTLFGLQSAERGLHDLFTLHHASRLTRLRKLMFPAARPAIFAGLRISAGLSVIGAIVGDYFFGQGAVGIGQLLKRYSSRLEGEELLAAVIMSSALGVVVFLFFGWLQNIAIGKWHESSGADS
ncbi:MAG: ABC transporter permease [Ilumatobacteraceae bacterium]|nr:ABC transporter permease [Ilumatobacteraceae bacterium]